MDNIQMVDLKSQYNNIKEEVDKGIQAVIDSTAFVKGKVVKDFEDNLAKYLQVKHVISCGNGTDALQVAMMALGLKPGDEVITTSFTFIATAEVIALLGLTPVLVDCDPNTYNITPEAIRKAITPKTKAIVPVHIFGQSVPMEEIMEIAKENNLALIEDNAQAIGADYIMNDGSKCKTGTMGDIGCTSFFPSKNLGAFGDGGAIFTNNDKLADKLRAIVNHGMKVRYYHDYVGVNSRLDGIQAAILDVKLRHLDEYAAARNYAANYYDKAFANHKHIITPARYDKSSHVFHQYTMKLKDADRDELKNFLNSKGVPMMVYYPVPLHLQKAYKDDRYSEGDFPITECLSKSVFSLPMHTEMNDEQLKYITDSVLEFFKK
ncbi:MAG: transcriptional regulator [Bacteroidetes bacterium]|nr:MAG: transcriptional regulator [Bacteroidota bacterium]